MIKVLQLVLQKIRMPKRHLKKIRRVPRKVVRMQSSMPRLLDWQQDKPKKQQKILLSKIQMTHVPTSLVTEKL
jgi:hypothetical protein